MGSKGTGREAEPHHFENLRQMIRAIEAEHACLSLRDLAVSGNDLLAIGFVPGPALGACLVHLLELVLSERLPNDASALITAARHYLENHPEETK